MLISIDVTFIFDSTVRVGLFSSAKILQLADVALRVIIPLKHLKWKLSLYKQKSYVCSKKIVINAW